MKDHFNDFHITRERRKKAILSNLNKFVIFGKENMQKILYEELLELSWYSLRKFRKIFALQRKVLTHIEKIKEGTSNLPPFQLK